jgi:hypothetical protein
VKTKLTKLEKFVWSNYASDFRYLASQTNRTVTTIERAYDRARRKVLGNLQITKGKP